MTRTQRSGDSGSTSKPKSSPNVKFTHRNPIPTATPLLPDIPNNLSDERAGTPKTGKQGRELEGQEGARVQRQRRREVGLVTQRHGDSMGGRADNEPAGELPVWRQ